MAEKFPRFCHGLHVGRALGSRILELETSKFYIQFSGAFLRTIARQYKLAAQISEVFQLLSFKVAE